MDFRGCSVLHIEFVFRFVVIEALELGTGGFSDRVRRFPWSCLVKPTPETYHALPDRV
jgi:hypothetical protein